MSKKNFLKLPPSNVLLIFLHELPFASVHKATATSWIGIALWIWMSLFSSHLLTNFTMCSNVVPDIHLVNRNLCTQDFQTNIFLWDVPIEICLCEQGVAWQLLIKTSAFSTCILGTVNYRAICISLETFPTYLKNFNCATIFTFNFQFQINKQ